MSGKSSSKFSSIVSKITKAANKAVRKKETFRSNREKTQQIPNLSSLNAHIA